MCVCVREREREREKRKSKRKSCEEKEEWIKKKRKIKNINPIRLNPKLHLMMRFKFWTLAGVGSASLLPLLL